MSEAKMFMQTFSLEVGTSGSKPKRYLTHYLTQI